MNVALLVEGHGDVAALPLLIRRIAASLPGSPSVQPLRPFRLARGQIVKDKEFERTIRLLSRQSGDGGAVLVLLDGDDDLGCVLGPRLLTRAKEVVGSQQRVGVVVAMREFESWFLASLHSLRGQRGLPVDLQSYASAETVRGAKEKLGALMDKGYSETLDQPAFAALLDLDEARRAASFDKLVRVVAELLGVPDRALAS